MNKAKKSTVKNNALKYDESYLDKLLKDKVDVKEEINEKNNQVSEDEIKLALSSTLKRKENNGINDYLIKFIVFVFLIIGLLYAVFFLFKTVTTTIIIIVISIVNIFIIIIYTIIYTII